MKRCHACSARYDDTVKFCPRDGAPLEEPYTSKQVFDPLLGTIIDGRYRVETLLGQGGMGRVYRACHTVIDKRVAVKVLRKEAGSDLVSAERFLREAKAASRIGHSGIVDITDFGRLNDSSPYFVMEFLDGPTLARLLAKGALEESRAVRIALEMARALSAAHQKNIVHRDLKPENIFVLPRGDGSEAVKIVDFGIAKDLDLQKKLTVAGVVLGTPEYLSPEQATGEPSDHRVDVYALGCILYEMVTGKVPFRGAKPAETLRGQVYDAPEPPRARRPDLALSKETELTILRALEKNPADRFANMADFARALEALRGSGRRKRVGSWTLPRSVQPLRLAFAVVAATVAIALAIALVRQRNLGTAPAKIAPKAASKIAPKSAPAAKPSHPAAESSVRPEPKPTHQPSKHHPAARPRKEKYKGLKDPF